MSLEASASGFLFEFDEGPFHDLDRLSKSVAIDIELVPVILSFDKIFFI